jgi:hypothetical protein
MPKFVIHIGPHKTGSTYLQLQFAWARAQLAERGVVLPECWELAPGNPSHLRLVEQLRQGQKDVLAPIFAELLARKEDIILLSSEDLSILEEGPLTLLRDFLGHAPVEFIFYVRRWSEMLPSTWQESIKQGRSHNLPEFVMSHFLRPNGSRLFNLDLKLSAFNAVFGAARLKLVSYSELRDRNIDVFQHFCASFLNWPDAAPQPTRTPVNASRSALEAELLRAINAVGHSRGLPPGTPLRRQFDTARTALDLSVPLAAMASHKYFLPVADDIPPLRGLHVAQMKKLGANLIEPRPPELFFQPKATKLVYVGSDYLLTPDVVPALNAAFDQLGVTA